METCRNQILSSLQHSFCHRHFNNFTMRFWRELQLLIKVGDKCSDSTRMRLFSIFPESPEVCTPDCWRNYQAWLMEPYTALEITRVGSEVADGALQIFANCSDCRMWSERQVIPNQEQQVALEELQAEYAELDNRLDDWIERCNRAKAKKRLARHAARQLLNEVDRLQVMLSQVYIPKAVKELYGHPPNPEIIFLVHIVEIWCFLKVLGAVSMVINSGKHPGQLKDDVASPGGTTIAGIHELEKGGFRGILMNTVVVAAERSREFSK